MEPVTIQTIFALMVIGICAICGFLWHGNDQRKAIKEMMLKQNELLFNVNHWAQVVVEQQKIMNDESRERHQELKRAVRGFD